MTDRPKSQVIFMAIILGLLATLGPVGQDMYIPSIPKIAEGLGTTTNLVVLSVSAVLFGNGIGQIVHGPLSDRFGRKPVIIGVLVLFTVSSGAAMWATSIEVLIVLRFFQGLAQSGGRILAAAVARDIFERERLGKMMSDIMFVTAIGTVIAPAAGGLIAEHLPWQASMGIMSAFGVIVILLFLFGYKESDGEPNPEALNPAILASNMKAIVVNKVFLVNTLCAAFMLSGFIVFLSISASVLIEGFGVRGDTYGFLFSGISACFLLGTFFSGRLVTRLGLVSMIGWGVLAGVIGGVSMAGLAMAGIKETVAVVIPMGIYIFGLAFVLPQATAGALTPFPEMAGTASSLSGFIQNMLGAAVSFLLTAFTHDDALVMATAIAVLGVGAAVIFLTGVRKTVP